MGTLTEFRLELLGRITSRSLCGWLACTSLTAVLGCAAPAPGPPPAAPGPPAVVIAPAKGGAVTPRLESSDACGPLGGAFTTAWPHLEARLEAGAEGLAELIDPARGVFVIDNPGAYVIPMYFESYEEAADRVASLRADYYSFTCSEPTEGPTPTFSCETELWTPEGCVVTRSPEFSVARWYDLAVEYGLTENDEVSADGERARQVDASIEYGVYTTDTPMGLYFSRSGCEWHVVAIDVVSPCSA